MNVLTAVGRIGKDAELRYTANEKAVLGFSVGSDVGFGDKKETLWVRCSIWGKRAEALAPHVLKGLPVTVTGEARLREYESQGQTRTSLELNVREIALQGKAEQKAAGGFREEAKPAPAAQPEQEAFDEDDIPFNQEAA